MLRENYLQGYAKALEKFGSFADAKKLLELAAKASTGGKKTVKDLVAAKCKGKVIEPDYAAYKGLLRETKNRPESRKMLVNLMEDVSSANGDPLKTRLR